MPQDLHLLNFDAHIQLACYLKHLRPCLRQYLTKNLWLRKLWIFIWSCNTTEADKHGKWARATTQIDQPPHKKKRGRPSKADLQARSEGQPSSEAGPAPRPPPVEPASATLQARTASLPEAGSIDQPSPEETRPLPPVSRMPISSILTPTVQQSTSQSSSSSGKRRRGRSTRSEPEDLPSAGTSGARAGQEYESPYARMAGQVQDSPARAAVLRHREEQDPRPPPHFEPRQPSAQAPPPTTTASE